MESKNERLSDEQVKTLQDILGIRLPPNFHIEINVKSLREKGTAGKDAQRVVLRRIGAETVRRSLGKVRVGQIIDVEMPA